MNWDFRCVLTTVGFLFILDRAVEIFTVSSLRQVGDVKQQANFVHKAPKKV